MVLFDEKKRNLPDNPYYMGQGCFNFPGLYNKFFLRIIGEFKVNGYSNLYQCNLCYRSIDNQDLFFRLVIGFDIDKMINDSKYTRFVFTRIINVNNLRKLNYSDFMNDSKSVNYIGSAMDINGNFVYYDDENIRNIVNFSSITRGGSINDEKRNRALMSSINRQAKIESLKIEKEKLMIKNEKYQK